MTKETKNFIRYSFSFKQKVVRIEMKDEKDRIKELEAEVKRLKMALADTVLTKDILQTVIQLADDHYGADLKKISVPSDPKSSRARISC